MRNRYLKMLVVTGLVLAASAPLSPAKDPQQAFGSGLTDIGPDARGILETAFITEAKAWLDAACFLLTLEKAATSDASTWIALANEYQTKLDTAKGAAKDPAMTFLSAKGWPKDWEAYFRQANAFVLYMATSGEKAYGQWANYAVWLGNYEEDATSTKKKITELEKDFKELDKRIGEWSTDWQDRKPVKTLKEHLEKIKKLRDGRVASALATIGKLRDSMKITFEDDDKKPSVVKDETKKLADSFKKAAEDSASVFPGTTEFAAEVVKNADALASDYEKAYKALQTAAEPIMGDHPPMLQEFETISSWKFGEIPAKLDELVKGCELEIVRREGIKAVD